MGHQAAAAILAMRANDGSQIPDPTVDVNFFCGNQPGEWRQDPITLSPRALGAYWGGVKPFVMQSSDQFRVPPPPAMTSAEYTDGVRRRPTPRRRRHRDTDRTHRGANADRDLLGLRWDAEFVCAAAAVQPNHRPTWHSPAG